MFGENSIHGRQKLLRPGPSISMPVESSASIRRLKQIDAEDADQRLQRMTEACSGSDEVIRYRQQKKSPGEEPCSRNAAMDGEGQPHKASKREEAEVHLADDLRKPAVPAFFDGVWDANPVEVDALQG